MVWGRKKSISNEYSNNGAKLLKEQVSNGATRRQPYPLRIFTSEELRTATRSFCERIDETRRGAYYKGTIDGRPVLVFRGEDRLEDRIEEIVMMSSIRHPNVVKLLGCCLETSLPLIVYEFPPNGNLMNYIELHDVRWSDRLRIATEIAEALAYLHHHGPTPIVHRSVNPKNVLLDESYSAKLTGFDNLLTIPLGRDWSPYGLHLMDVSSFGGLLFTISTGKSPLDPAVLNGSDPYDFQGNLHAWSKWMEQAAEDFVRKEGEGLRLEVQAFYELLVRCIKLTGGRLTMKEVVRELWKISRMGAIHQIAASSSFHASPLTP